MNAISDAHFLSYIHKLQNMAPLLDTNSIAENWWLLQLFRLTIRTIRNIWLHCKKTDRIVVVCGTF